MPTAFTTISFLTHDPRAIPSMKPPLACYCASALLLCFVTPATGAAQGTIAAEMDGEVRTWYSVAGEAEDGPYSSSVWSDLDEVRTVMIGGLDEQDPSPETLPRGGVASQGTEGSYDGSSLTIAIQLRESGPGEYALERGSSSQIIFAPDASRISSENLYMVVEGTLLVEEVRVADEVMSIRGTFAGRLDPVGGGDPIELVAGRFDVGGIPSARSIISGG